MDETDPSSASLEISSGGDVGGDAAGGGCRRVAVFCAVQVFMVLVALVTAAVAFTAPRNIAGVPAPPDYATPWAWAALPSVADDADVVPAACGEDNQNNNQHPLPPADTFYVHPTSFFSEMDNAPIGDLATNTLTDAGQLTQQASVFNGVSRVFAPRYRQASQSVQNTQDTWNNNNGSDRGTRLQAAMDLAFHDVVAAFDYFLREYSSDPTRPIILASHSQGTMHMKRLLATTSGWHKIADRIVAAYLVGNTVAASGEIPDILPPCSRANATNCFVSWNTMVEGADPAHWNSKMSCWNQTSGAPANNNHQGTNGCACACANPLDWSWMSNSSVDKSRHFGGMNVLGSLFLRNFDAELVGARCDPASGMLFVKPAKPFYNTWGYFEDMTFKANGELHAYDYTLFYRNIRVNVQERVNAWLAARPSSSDSTLLYVEPKTCAPCGSRPRCGWQWFVQIMTAIFFGWLFCAALCGGCCVCGLVGYRYRRAEKEGATTMWPNLCELVACSSCCCCCAKCCAKLVSNYHSRYGRPDSK